MNANYKSSFKEDFPYFTTLLLNLLSVGPLSYVTSYSNKNSNFLIELHTQLCFMSALMHRRECINEQKFLDNKILDCALFCDLFHPLINPFIVIVHHFRITSVILQLRLRF